MTVLIVRCANGIVVWVRSGRGETRTWNCRRDGFTVNYNLGSNATVEAGVLAIAQHSAQLAGAVQQVAQLDL